MYANRYVAAMFNDSWYVGKVLAYESDDEDLPYKISCMEHCKSKVGHTFKWPVKEDIIWRQRVDILCIIDEPIPGGTRKMFKLQVSGL